jgi:N-acetylglutamate synthase
MTISIADLERAAAAGWRAVHEETLGDWLLRAADGFTGRANSALAIGDPGVPLAAATDQVCRWYQARGLPAQIAITFPIGQPRCNPVDQFVDALGWTVRTGAAVMTAAPGTVRDQIAGASAAEVDDTPDAGWLALYRYRGQRPPPVSRQLLMSAPWQAFASIRSAHRTVAIGRVAVARNWAGLTAVQVHPRYRRRGLARAVTAALAAAAAQRRVDGLYLQVDDENTAARALYLGLGFTDHHRYQYRVAPPLPAPLLPAPPLPG